MPGIHRRTREPVQVWLDRPDAALLDELVERLGLPKAEVIRQAVRRFAQDLEAGARPGAGVSALTGALDGDEAIPADLAARHDDYLYGDEPAPATRRH